MSHMLASGYMYVILLYKFCIIRQQRPCAETKCTYSANGIERAIVNKGVLNTCLVAFVSARIAITDRAPSWPYASAAAGEEEIVVELVFLDCWTSATS